MQSRAPTEGWSWAAGTKATRRKKDANHTNPTRQRGNPRRPSLALWVSAGSRHWHSIFRELLTYMMEDPRNIGICTHFLFGAKNLERIGDHATNIAETVHYMVEGETIPEERPKLDNTSSTVVGDHSF